LFSIELRIEQPLAQSFSQYKSFSCHSFYYRFLTSFHFYIFPMALSFFVFLCYSFPRTFRAWYLPSGQNIQCLFELLWLFPFVLNVTLIHLTILRLDFLRKFGNSSYHFRNLSLYYCWSFSIFKNPTRQIPKTIWQKNILDKVHKVSDKRQMNTED
jgi:hypothetical protein